MSNSNHETDPKSHITHLFGHLLLKVPGLKSKVERAPGGQPYFDIDPDDPKAVQSLDVLQSELTRPELQGFMQQILNGQKKAAYRVVAEGLAVVVFAAAFAEIGLRHGRDLQNLLDKIEQRKKGKQQ